MRMFYRGIFAVLLLGFLALPSLPAESKDKIDKAYYSFADRLVNTINKGDPTVFDNAIDFDVMMDRITRGVKISPSIINPLKKGFSAGFKMGQKLTSQRAKLELLRLDKEDVKVIAYIRMLLPGGGVNYYKMRLQEKKGTVKIEDFFVFATGEYLSVTLGRNILPALIKRDSQLKGQKVPINSDFIDNQAAIQKMSMALQAGKFKDVLNIYKTLPQKLREDKLIMMMRFKASMGLGSGSPEYTEAMKDLKKAYPNDPSLDLLLMDLYFQKREYNKVIQCLDNINKRLGCRDPYLDVMYAVCYRSMKNYKKAEAYALKAIKNESDLEPAYSMLLKIAIDKKDWKNVCKYLDLTKKNLGVPMNNIERLPLYVDFVKTKEYKEWKKKN